jgi:uncharacterized protein DUF6894
MRTYYFDTKDGIPVRDNKGIDFSQASEAIEHSKKLAAGIRSQAQKRDRNLTIVVTDESGQRFTASWYTWPIKLIHPSPYLPLETRPVIFRRPRNCYRMAISLAFAGDRTWRMLISITPMPAAS